MATAEDVQVLQDGHLGVKPTLNAVLGACLLSAVEGTGGDGLATDALGETDVIQGVNG